MGEKKQVARSYIAQGLTRNDVLGICGISKHQYYYRPRAGSRGRRASEQTLKIDRQGNCVSVSDAQVVKEIEQVLQDPDKAYGYRKMAFHLAHRGYLINHKKVYRLMKQNHLLKEKPRSRQRNYVRYRIVTPERPLQVLEMDIKLAWVEQDKRNVYILTIIDTFTRVVLHWSMGYQMRWAQVKATWEQVIVTHLQPADLLSQDLHIELRNDNGPQFAAARIRKYLKDNHINQVFTHPYTPQENGHIESFHAILKNCIQQSPVWSFTELEQRLTLFYEKYNNERLHGSLAYLAPHAFWNLWNRGKIERVELSGKRIKFKLKIPRHKISGNMSLREVPCSNSIPLDGDKNLQSKEVIGPEALQTTSVQQSPSVVPC